MRTTVMALAAASALLASGAAHATSYTFATFQQLGTTKIASYTPGTVGSTLTINGGVLFVGTCCTVPAFSPPPALFTDAVIALLAVSFATVVDTGPQFEQPGFAGTISFTSPSNPGLNLLTVDFTNGVLNVGKGNPAGASLISIGASTIQYTSDIFVSELIAFPVDFAIEMTAVQGLPFGVGNGFGTPFKANAGGAFSAAIPEPSTWAMLIAGFGIVGWSVRRRRMVSTLA